MISNRFWQGCERFGVDFGRVPLRYVCRILLLILALGSFSGLTGAQDQGASQPGKGQAEPPADAGGPQGDVGPYAVPKKKDEPPPPPPTEKPKKIEGMPDYSIHVDVPVVEVPVMVTTKDGQFISSLTTENFRVFEDGTQQTISGFTVSDAPITAVLLVEFAAGDYYFLGDIWTASYSFAATLKKDDWLAVISYDMKSYI